MASLQDRVIGALKLQASTFEDVEHDVGATSQAATVVALGAVSGGLAALVYGNVSTFVLQVVLAMIGWVIGAGMIFLVGTKLLPGRNTEADFGQLLRTVGFAQAPNLFGVVTIIPILGFLIGLGIAIWAIVALVIAVRQALDYEDTLKAVIVCLVAWVIMFLVTLLGGLLGFGAAAAGGRLMS